MLEEKLPREKRDHWIENSVLRKRLGGFFTIQFLMTLLVGFSVTLFATAALGQVQNRSNENSPQNSSFAMVFPELDAADLDPTPTQTPDAYYSSYFANSWEMPEISEKTYDFWIKVNLSEQILYTYRGDRLLKTFYVSTGTKSFQTVTGTFRIYAKYSQYDMRGPGYELYDVPYAMFFHKGYSIHGTYWHDNFGTPMSRGCVNMRTEDAAWIYENAPVGTYVFIHY